MEPGSKHPKKFNQSCSCYTQLELIKQFFFTNHQNFTTPASAKKVVKNQAGAIVSSTTGFLIKILLTTRSPDCGSCCTENGMECFASFAEYTISKVHSITEKTFNQVTAMGYKKTTLIGIEVAQ